MLTINQPSYWPYLLLVCIFISFFELCVMCLLCTWNEIQSPQEFYRISWDNWAHYVSYETKCRRWLVWAPVRFCWWCEFLCEYCPPWQSPASKLHFSFFPSFTFCLIDPLITLEVYFKFKPTVLVSSICLALLTHKALGAVDGTASLEPRPCLRESTRLWVRRLKWTAPCRRAECGPCEGRASGTVRGDGGLSRSLCTRHRRGAGGLAVL